MLWQSSTFDKSTQEHAWHGWNRIYKSIGRKSVTLAEFETLVCDQRCVIDYNWRHAMEQRTIWKISLRREADGVA